MSVVLFAVLPLYFSYIGLINVLRVTPWVTIYPAKAPEPLMPRPATAPKPAYNRSRVTNGTRAFMSADGLTSEARLLRDREREFAEPFGGLDGLSLSHRSKVEAAAMLSVRLEVVRSGLASGAHGITDEDLTRLTNGLSRALAALDKLTGAAPTTGRAALEAHMRARGEAA